MGKYILVLIAGLVVIGGLFSVGYVAGVTAQSGRFCEMQEDQSSDEKVCVVDGVTYAPVEEGDR